MTSTSGREQSALVVLATWGSLSDAEVDSVNSAIRQRGAWASWWSFPINSAFREALRSPFYVYLNVGGARITHRMLVEDFRTSQGNEGIETPWPDITNRDWLGKTRRGPKNSEIFKTWFRITEMERLALPLTLDDFDAAEGIKRSALLNQSAFGYAFLHAQRTEIVVDSPIQRHIDDFLASYVEARRSTDFSSDAPAYKLMERIRSSFAKLPAVAQRPLIDVKGSVGQGNWVGVPWVAFLDSRETATTQEGVYGVLLFRPDMSGAYLTFAQGVTEPEKRLGKVEARRYLRQNIDALRPRCSSMRRRGFALDDNIDLRATSGVGSKYADSVIAYKFYEAGQVPLADQINADLEAVLRDYDTYVNLKMPRPADAPTPPLDDATSLTPITPEMSITAIIDDFASALTEAGLSLGKDHRDVAATFLSSLATKRFVILTGLSGSGKTQLALRFGEWLGNDRSRLVPVRPDWTGAEAIFGYEDALRPAFEGRRAWHVPDPLKLLLTAAANAGSAYLLILDEMNLAHVERYFADALSGMESDTPVIPNLAMESDGQWRIPPNAPEFVPFPTNLFLVGTVNVDETTYMFSPKVLDRANTIEFRVTTDALGARTRPIRARSGPPELVAGFLALARDWEWAKANPAKFGAQYHTYLTKLHSILSVDGFEFGHRSYYEITRFADLIAPIVGNDIFKALDFQVLQKMLPRLHGSRRRLEPVLASLASFCLNPDSESMGREFDPLAHQDTSPALPRSFAKLQRMTRMLRANQFASFAE